MYYDRSSDTREARPIYVAGHSQPGTAPHHASGHSQHTRAESEISRPVGGFITASVRGFAAVVRRRLVERYCRWRERRQAIRTLMRLDDQHLADVGLTRRGIHAAVNGDFARSPTLYRATLSWAEAVGDETRRRRSRGTGGRRRARERRSRGGREHARRVESALGSAVAHIRKRKSEADRVG